ncbi:AAA family ATPase [Candidatus Protochlamydia phocaeensis]|uniref:AAA family ATPase n=1 Tax=Candidatus Protochlamydia phocaeensis TaxID=1414722 RepID=UPI0008380E5F|nr:MoxR family ATPase [Candidatus Protochlamydia phocaeensis]
MNQETRSIPSLIQEAQTKIDQIKRELGKVVIGQTHLINGLLIGLFADGHLLLEGVPGLAKTLAATTFARIIDCEFKRIQFTPDLLPADLIGTPIYNPKEGTFSVKKGPIFTNILLADEINRAPSKVQSALLEVMQEKQVTISGETFQAPRPFLVLATQNPIEQEGTYPLSEAQTDRFMMKIKLTYPKREEEKEILNRMGTLGPLPAVSPVLKIEEILSLRQLVDSIYLDEKVADYILNIISATRHPEQFQLNDLEGLLEYGASPRATLALKEASKAHALLAGRYFVTPQDIKEICRPVLRHRLLLSYEAEAENLSSDDIIDRILQGIPVP